MDQVSAYGKGLDCYAIDAISHEGPVRLPRLVEGRFLRRENRFMATVAVSGAETAAHLPNSGRLRELLVAARTVWLAPRHGPRRKTGYDLTLVQYGSILVSVDARIPSTLFEEALADGSLGWEAFSVEREVKRGASRLDFRLSGPGGVCWVETKSVTLVEEGLARFPDAPTQRGQRHLQELIDAVKSGERAAVVFIVQRPDARRFTPHRTADPGFAERLSQALETGVEVLAYNCRVSLNAIAIARRIPIVPQVA